MNNSLPEKSSRGSAEWNPLIGEYIGPPEAPYYVYMLVDPLTRHIFYVGKGTGDRFREHGVAALLLPDGATAEEAGEKLGRIRAIRDAGREPEVEFARIKIATEREAYLVEATLIDALSRDAGPLANAVRGHDSEHGLVTLRELEQKLAAPIMATNLHAILIKLGWWTPDDDRELPRQAYGFRPRMTAQDLYDSARAWWVMSQSRALKYPYAVAVFQGLTRGVWEIDHSSWRFSDAPTRGRASRRWAFEGRIASAEVVDAFVGRLGRRVPQARPSGGAVFGSGSPIAYWPN